MQKLLNKIKYNKVAKKKKLYISQHLGLLKLTRIIS